MLSVYSVVSVTFILVEPRHEKTGFAYAKTKAQISVAVTDSTTPLLFISKLIVQYLSTYIKNFEHRVVSDLVGNPEDRFSHVAAQLILAEWLVVNPLTTNGLSHHYQLGESTFIFGVLGVIFIFITFLMKFLCAKRIAPDGTPRSAASHLGLCCLPMPHKMDDRLTCV